MIFTRKATEVFDVRQITDSKMESYIKACGRIYAGEPDWCTADGDISTINMSKSICSETARLATLAIGIKMDGSARAEWLQKQIDDVYSQIRSWVELGCAYGTVILKPNGNTIEAITPDRFMITDTDGKKITGCVFFDEEVSADGKKFYTRLEYHRYTDYENKIYEISNKCYVGKSRNDMHEEIAIEDTPWNGLMEESGPIYNIEHPLFGGVFITPHANNIDPSSPLGMPIFSDALQELMDLDIAYSRNAKEIDDSKRVVLLDSDRLMPSGGKIRTTIGSFDMVREQMGLPDYVRAVYGDGQETMYQEINPTLNTDVRLSGINALLSQIGYKVGFSNGYFVFNEKTGIQTATGVEAEQQRTVQLIKDVRDRLQDCIENLIYALDAIAELYGITPAGSYKTTFDFGDILYNHEEDKVRWYGYATSGKIPFWYYLVKFEGMTEEEAKAITSEANPPATSLFGEME